MHERGLGIHILGNNQHVLTAHISRALVHAGLVLLNIWGGRDLASQNSVFFEEVIKAQGLHELMVLLPPRSPISEHRLFLGRVGLCLKVLLNWARLKFLGLCWL